MSMKSVLAGVLGAALCAYAPCAAASNLVQNGGFENTTIPGPGQPAAGYVPNWNIGFGVTIWFPGTADSPSNIAALWGPNNGSNNGLPATSPDGGNFLEQDANFNTTAFTQTITGLNPSQTYQLDFDWGAGQWRYASAVSTTNQWIVSLGAQTQSTAIVNEPYMGFSGWMHQTFLYTPTNATEVLSFISQGSGDPPLALLDGVSLVAVPEPAEWAMLLMGFAGLGVAARVRRRVRAAAA
jgi:hypothetical protein